MRTEMVACFVTSIAEPDTVLDLYTSSDLRRDVESRIDRMSVEGLAAEHSQVVWNKERRSLPGRVLQREPRDVRPHSGGHGLPLHQHSRSVRLGRLKRAIGRGKIKGSQEDNARALAARISG